MSLARIRRSSYRLLLSMLLGVVGFTGACRGYAQDHNQPPLPVALTLPQAIDLALKQNRTLQLARLAVTETEHKKTIARSAYYPQIKNDSSILHVTELAGIEIPTGAFGSPSATGAIPGKSLFIGQGSATTYTSGTGLAQPLTQMFKIHESDRAATSRTAPPRPM